MGDRFYQFALLYVILGIKQGLDAGKDSARVTFCAMLPGLLLAPLYGWTIDRYSRRWVMFYADIARAVLTLTFLYLWFHAHSLAAVFTVVFLMGALNGLFIRRGRRRCRRSSGPRNWSRPTRSSRSSA